jgi:formylglycine-generating enzyme required for sulfatase activity
VPATSPAVAAALATRVAVAEALNQDLNPFVFIEGGRFQMGSPDGVGSDDERPQHGVTLSSFYIQQFEVTNGEYQLFKEEHEFPPDEASYPVVNVTWQDAVDYGTWLGGTPSRSHISASRLRFRQMAASNLVHSISPKTPLSFAKNALS